MTCDAASALLMISNSMHMVAPECYTEFIQTLVRNLTPTVGRLVCVAIVLQSSDLKCYTNISRVNFAGTRHSGKFCSVVTTDYLVVHGTTYTIPSNVLTTGLSRPLVFH